MRVIGKVGLTAEQKAARADGAGGSDSNIIASGDGERIERLRLEKLGRIEPEDLSRVIPVVFGQLTEDFNLDIFEMETGLVVTREGESCVSAEYDWRRCTLDGFVESERAVVQAKCVNAFSKPDEVVQKYMPQLHHEMDVVGVERAYLTVFIGTMKWDYWLVERDADYAAALLDLEAEFWRCVQEDKPWPGYAAPVAPVAPTEFREVDLTGSNEWAASAADWLENKAAANTFKKAVEDIKKLVEPDVGRAHGHGIEAKRSKAGAITIKELKA
tara:strand:+ start:1276 stop:2091 length:816 start_codon:yes stop_codon:yes gene_type:complete